MGCDDIASHSQRHIDDMFGGLYLFHILVPSGKAVSAQIAAEGGNLQAIVLNDLFPPLQLLLGGRQHLLRNRVNLYAVSSHTGTLFHTLRKGHPQHIRNDPNFKLTHTPTPPTILIISAIMTPIDSFTPRRKTSL